ncbi:MAG: lamin tail domain-containing protein [Myxococcales bacterium]|nr:lamin tail domain-containing protein [Myxococcales bacterium]
MTPNHQLLPLLFILTAYAPALLTGCMPGLPDAPVDDEPGPATTDDALPWSVTVLPDGHLQRAPSALRLRVRLAPGAGLGPLDATQLMLFSGEITAGQLSHFADARISEALQARLVPALTWPLDDEEAILAPTELLEPGVSYTLASASPRFSVGLTIDDADEVPTMRYAWPPGGQSASGAQGVWCGEAELPLLMNEVSLAPRGVHATLQRGVTAGELSTRCVYLESGTMPPNYSGELLPPLFVRRPGAIGLAHAPEERLARLEPQLLARRVELPAPLASADCQGELVPFGPACALVEDDRVVLAMPDAALFFSVVALSGGGFEQVFTSTPGGVVLHPFAPSSTPTLMVTSIDDAGYTRSAVVTLATKPPMSHVILSEVFANPLGPEPAQEWVELYNDGLVPALLGGSRFRDIGGETVLPEAVLAPGQYALVVGEDYVDNGEYDAAPAPGTLILRVPRLGKSGLANSGEPLELINIEGKVLSRFPALKTKAGRSVFRIAPKSLDGFMTSEPNGATPGAANVEE